mgnify:CR=1 FL=1
MTEDDLIDRLDRLLVTKEAVPGIGEEFRTPPLAVLRYYARPVRLSRLPLLSRAASVVVVARHPPDLPCDADGFPRLVDRLARAVQGRYPPWTRPFGLAIGCTMIVLTTDPIQPDDDALLAAALKRPRRARAVPLALFRINPDQDALALTLAGGLDELFVEPALLADSFCESLRRFVPRLDLGSLP